mmetsp:Transcript_11168/g.14450  ORF Transcript_11168/g.14450 Transcript_11168/m.14450 type:complete len:237 (-) Transcript_11168:24-734(-)
MGKYDALFAKQAYIMVKSGSKSKRINEINKNIEHTGFHADEHLSNRDILYLVNDKTKEIHIAHRGTDSTGSKKTKTDIRQDLNFALGREEHDKATQKNVNRTNNLVKQAPKDYKISMSSHSLGNVAMMQSLKKKKEVRRRVSEANSFNGASSPFTDNKVSKNVEKELKNKVVHNRTKADIVSINHNNSIGKVVTHETKDLKKIKKIPSHLNKVFTDVQQLKHHSISNFIDEDDEKK